MLMNGDILSSRLVNFTNSSSASTIKVREKSTNVNDLTSLSNSIDKEINDEQRNFRWKMGTS